MKRWDKEEELGEELGDRIDVTYGICTKEQDRLSRHGERGDNEDVYAETRPE